MSIVMTCCEFEATMISAVMNNDFVIVMSLNLT